VTLDAASVRFLRPFDCTRGERAFIISAANDSLRKERVLATRKFGTTCPVCKRFCFLGYVELDEKASIGELRAKLLHDGWKGEVARCDYRKCEGEVYCPWNAAVFPR